MKYPQYPRKIWPQYRNYFQRFYEAENPMIIVGAEALQGDSGDILLAQVQKLAAKLRKSSGTDLIIRIICFREIFQIFLDLESGKLFSILDSRKIFNILHRFAAQVGAMDVGYKVLFYLFLVMDVQAEIYFLANIYFIFQMGTKSIVNSPQKIQLLYLLGADEGTISRKDLAPDAFIIYQGYHLQYFLLFFNCVFFKS